MAHFVHDTNNGVTALVTIEDYKRMQNQQPLEQGIFLFTDAIDWSVQAQPWFHGNREMMAQLTEGHTMEHGSIGVPFSNGQMLYSTREALLGEILQIAPMHKLLEAFEVTLQPAAVPVS